MRNGLKPKRTMKNILNVKTLTLVLFTILLLTGCSTTRTIEVPVEKIRTEYKTDTVLQYKNLVVKDSVFINQYVNGDTVYRDKYKYKYINNTDTLYRDRYIHVTDSIDRPVYIEKEIEVSYVPWYAKILSWIGGITLLVLGFKLVRIYLKTKGQ